jgi:hypothetical protein
LEQLFILDIMHLPDDMILTLKRCNDSRNNVALGNGGGNSPKCRDLVLGHGGLFLLLQQLNEHANLSMLRNATWTLQLLPWEATTKL